MTKLAWQSRFKACRCQCAAHHKAWDFIRKLVPEGGSSSSAGTPPNQQRPIPFQGLEVLLLVWLVSLANFLDLANKLSAASVLTPEDRVLRAWLSAFHAKAALEGTSPPALRVVPIDLPSKYFAVARGADITEPKIRRSAKDF